jgi:hypothetical protein
MTVDFTGMWCGVGMDKGRLLCKVMHLHLHEVTVFLVVCASLKFLVDYRNYN